MAKPLAKTFDEGLKAKTNDFAMAEFQKRQQKDIADTAKKIDDWEKKLAGLPMVSHY
ncbi:MAG: hypothetical protein HYZ46_07150 [Nitrosomonadales bacterium]|nr:hypothetical protein [Nitrosomonadales bacterium]